MLTRFFSCLRVSLDLLLSRCTTYVGLVHVDKDMIGRCGNLDAGERRKLWCVVYPVFTLRVHRCGPYFCVVDGRCRD